MIRIQHILLPILLVGAVVAKPATKLEIEPKWKNRGQVVFLGDSITDWWKNDGKQTWDQFYEPLGSVNTGVAGDRTTTIIDRINNQGIIDNLNAYLAVLKIGTNDLSGGVPEQDIANNIQTIINLIKTKNPGVKILLLGIMPRGGSEIHQRIRNVNFIIQNYASQENVYFLNMEQQFSTGLGQVIPELYWADQLHLSSQGYEVWARTMNPTFDIILNAPFASKAVWLGDSLTSQWLQTGTSVWNQFYAPIQSSNFAISGHTSTQTIDRIEREGVLNGLNAKVAMLMVGGNDLQSGNMAPQVIANIARIIELIRERLPHGRILLMGLLPAGGKPDWLIEQGKLINDALALMNNDDDIRYIDMRNEFADENENIHEELYQLDQTHLSLLGYQLWHRTIDSLLQELLQFR